MHLIVPENMVLFHNMRQLIRHERLVHATRYMHVKAKQYKIIDDNL